MNDVSGLDILSAVNTILGLANYGENITQRGMQQDLSVVIADVHSDFEAQNRTLADLERKVDVLMNAMGVKDEIPK